jgi:hypothetical protein
VPVRLAACQKVGGRLEPTLPEAKKLAGKFRKTTLLA